MKSSPSLDQSLSAVYKLLHRYHIVLFVVIVLGGLAVVMFLLNNTIRSSVEVDPTTVTPVSAGFDQATIEKLENLKVDSGSSQPLNFPAGRINPFVE